MIGFLRQDLRDSLRDLRARRLLNADGARRVEIFERIPNSHLGDAIVDGDARHRLGRDKEKELPAGARAPFRRGAGV